MSAIFYLAPIRGITDQIYRNTVGRLFPGFDRAVAPFITVGTRKGFKQSQLCELDPKNDIGIPTVPQLLTDSPDEFVRIATKLFELGHSTINWNLGCPFKVVLKKGKGAALLSDAAKVAAILDQIVPQLCGRLSIKLRLGHHRSDEIEQLLPVLNRYPLTELIIHPRTATQMYLGDVDFNAFARCLTLTDHPIVYSGDIVSVAFFESIKNRFPKVTRWMIGRGALRDPFLMQRIKKADSLSPEQKRDKLKQFHDELFEAYAKRFSGKSHLLDHMKAVWSYLARQFENETKVFKKIKKTQQLDQYQSIVTAIFKQDFGL